MQYTILNISDFFRHYKQAAWDKDIQGMIGLYDDNVLIFDMWEKGFVKGLEEWSGAITAWLSSLKDEKVVVTFEMIDIQESAHVAFASALIGFQAIDAEGLILRSMKNRISLGFEKTDGTWKAKHQHTSAPIDGDLKGILDL